MKDQPRLTFGIIVLNGEPFTCYNLRSLYPFAHQIIVVEGACPKSEQSATRDGHSVDGTLEALQRFKADEDVEDKVIIVTAEDEGHPSGFWPGEKDEQSRAYAKRATGDWLWQIDIDEFYRAEDLEKVCTLLCGDPTITALSFFETSFWGGFGYYVDGPFLRQSYSHFHRVFRWAPGYTYQTHRPPTVTDERGRDLRTIHWLDARQTKRLGIRLYHYSQVFPVQVRRKMGYYDQMGWSKIQSADQWVSQTYFHLANPFRVHAVNTRESWLVRFGGRHPRQIERLRQDIGRGAVHIELRNTGDLDALVDSRTYRAQILSRKARANLVSPLKAAGYGLLHRQTSVHRFLRTVWETMTGQNWSFPLVDR